MYILIDSEGTLRAIGSSMTEDTNEQGVIWVNGAGYGLVGQRIVEVVDIPEFVIPDKYKYVDGEFVINENYRNSDEEIQLLREQQALMQTALDDIILNGGGF